MRDVALSINLYFCNLMADQRHPRGHKIVQSRDTIPFKKKDYNGLKVILFFLCLDGLFRHSAKDLDVD